jgi:hypothetical protein
MHCIRFSNIVLAFHSANQTIQSNDKQSLNFLSEHAGELNILDRKNKRPVQEQPPHLTHEARGNCNIHKT